TRAVGGAGAGHRRLAVVEPERGAQRLGTAAGDLWLVGDGEVYNPEDLRAELGEHRFRTRSDHEVVLHLVEDAGLRAFERLWGAFAFVLAGEDGRSEERRVGKEGRTRGGRCH